MWLILEGETIDLQVLLTQLFRRIKPKQLDKVGGAIPSAIFSDSCIKGLFCSPWFAIFKSRISILSNLEKSGKAGNFQDIMNEWARASNSFFHEENPDFYLKTSILMAKVLQDSQKYEEAFFLLFQLVLFCHLLFTLR
jgi:hypothetical protein